MRHLSCVNYKVETRNCSAQAHPNYGYMFFNNGEELSYYQQGPAQLIDGWVP